MRRVIAHVSGKVQRNGYRSAVSIRAREFNLTGYVMNLADGRVKIVAEGEEDGLQEFCESLWINDYLIQVDDVQVEFSKAIGDYENFFWVLDEYEDPSLLDEYAEYFKELLRVFKEGFREINGTRDEDAEKQEDMTEAAEDR